MLDAQQQVGHEDRASSRHTTCEADPLLQDAEAALPSFPAIASVPEHCAHILEQVMDLEAAPLAALLAVGGQLAGMLRHGLSWSARRSQDVAVSRGLSGAVLILRSLAMLAVHEI